jgi:hypothetical protein
MCRVLQFQPYPNYFPWHSIRMLYSCAQGWLGSATQRTYTIRTGAQLEGR